MTGFDGKIQSLTADLNDAILLETSDKRMRKGVELYEKLRTTKEGAQTDPQKEAVYFLANRLLKELFEVDTSKLTKEDYESI